MAITCGIAWAENQNDVALVDGAGQLVAKRRISDNVEGYRQLLQLLVEAGDTAQDPIPVAVETARGLLISRLRGTTRAVYSINAMAVARYRNATEWPGRSRIMRMRWRGQHPAHRRRHAPAAARGLRAGPGDRGAGPSRAGRGVETATSCATSCAPTSSSTSPAHWRRSRSAGSAWTPGRPERSWRSHRTRLPQ